MATEKKDRPWDGRSRPSDDKYRKEFDRIFKQKTLNEELMEGFEKEQRDLNESYRQSLKNKKEHTNEEE